jgi:hypothetical protein
VRFDFNLVSNWMSFEISTLSKPTFRAIEPPNPRTVSHLPWIEYLVAQIFPRWNPLTSWMRQIEDFQRAA